MTTDSDLASAARRRFLGGVGLAVTCTGAITRGGSVRGFEVRAPSRHEIVKRVVGEAS